MGLNHINCTHHGCRVLEEECRLTSQDAGQHSNAGACPPPANVGVARLPTGSPLAPQPGPTNPGCGPGSGRAWRAAGERLYAAAATVLQNVDSCRTWTYYLYPRLSFLRNQGENLRNTNWTQSLDALTQLLQAAEVQLIWVCNRAIAPTRSSSTRFHVEAICTIQRTSQVTAQLPLDTVLKHFLVSLKPF